MQIFNVSADPLDKELDISNMRVEKGYSNFSFEEKIKLWLDTLYLDSKLTKKEFYSEVENYLKEFCEK